MNFNRILSRNKEEERFYYLQEHTPDNLATSLLQWIPRFKQNVIILCIGTDRSTGDALVPWSEHSFVNKNLQVYLCTVPLIIPFTLKIFMST